MTIYHKHHIIPKHMGGTDDPSNLVYVTVEQHANLHKQLWEEFGHWQDELAYKGLAKLISHNEATLIAATKANLGKIFSEEHRRNISEALKGQKFTEERKFKISQTRLSKKIPSSRKGINLSSETKDKLSSTAKSRQKVLCSCGKTVDVSNHARWHKKCQLERVVELNHSDR